MQISKLRLSGFKSFVEPAELRIEPGLTGIVGPNGCGKSNLLEAIRWVMGESSPKSMRGGGMEDVIFAGTAQRPARDFAEVALVADTEGQIPPSLADAANGDELEVIRRIERGAGSAYRANGKDVRAKDVALIFADAATGAHSPALVSQGKIAAVIAAKPVERRQMLEEAAGIAGLHVRRKDAEQKLRATETNLARLADLLGDMENRMGALRRQARAAERYTRLTDELRVAEGRVIFARWRDAAAAADAAKAEAQKAEAAVLAAQEAQQAAAAYHTRAMETLSNARNETQVARDEAAILGAKLARLTSEEAALTRRLEDLAEQLQRISDDRSREDDLATLAASTIATLEADGKALTAAIATHEQEQPALAERLAFLASALRDAEVALAQARAEQASAAADRRIASAALDSARTRLARAQADHQRAAAERDRLGAVQPLEAARQRAVSSVTEAESAITTAEQAQADAENRREQTIAALTERDAALAEARTALATLESEHKALERAMAAGGSGQNRALDAITAKPGFERALAAALGDDLSLPLGGDAPRRWMGAEPLASDPALAAGLEPLARLVGAPPELARRLAQIGVADHDSGQSLAVGQRLVTKDGRLRRWDGLVIEDEGAPAAETLIRRNRLAALERELPGAREAVSAAQSARETAQEAAQSAQAAIETARQQRSAADTALRQAMRARDEAEAALTRHARDSEAITARLASISAELEEAQAAFTATETVLAALPASDVGDAHVAELDRKADEARTALNQVRDDEAALLRGLAEKRERQAALTAEIKGWRARSGEAAKRVEDMAKREATLNAEQYKSAGAPEKLREEIAALSEQQAGLGETLAARSAAEREAESDVACRDAAMRDALEALSLARETRAGASARAGNEEARRIEIGQLSGERFQCPPPLIPEKLGFDGESVGDPHTESAAHDRLHQDRERIGPVNLVAATELAELETEHGSSEAEAEELQQAVNRLRGSIGNLNREGRMRLLEAFETVNGHFKRLFTTLFNGGAAHLELIDSDDPLEAGLEIFAQPPGKKLAALTLLSGGEQALTAVALIFGLFLTNPAPICVLDEVDAPLDDANIERFCDLLDEMVQNTRTRYLIVTHNAVTMSRMHRLFGVTMVERGVSRLVSVDLGGAEELLAAE